MAKDKIVIRNLDLSDFKDITKVEKRSWPEELIASEKKLRERLEIFPEGFLGAYIDGKLVGFGTSQIIDYEGKAKGWNELTADGYISKTHKAGGNALHLVSLGVIPEARRMGIGKKLLVERMHLAKHFGLKYVITNIRIPTYSNFCKTGNEIPPEEYIKKGKDPLVKWYLKQGFTIKGIIKDNMNDSESRNCGVFMIKKL